MSPISAVSAIRVKGERVKKLFTVHQFGILAGAILSLAYATSARALDLDFGLYMRAPVGTNSSGGKQITLKNPGSRGNEFRLGNEEGYGELKFTGHVLKAQKPHDPFFLANMTLAIGTPMNSQYSDTTSAGDNFHLVQSYAEGGNFDGVLASFWAGKRFYRDVDVHMDDFYYFADMGGVGGGVGQVALGRGELAVAFLQSADGNFRDSTLGLPAKQVLDFRLFNWKLSEKDALHFWTALGYSAPGTGQVLSGASYVPADFEAGRGAIFGLRYGHDLEKGHNDLALMFGTGVLEDFSMNKVQALTSIYTDLNAAKRWRLVESFYQELSSRWSVQTAFIYEGAKAGTGTQSRWLSFGARPLYYFTEHYHLAVEGGFSMVRNSSETDGSGHEAGDRTLARLALAPEVAFASSFFARPLIRAYVAHTWWNGANGDQSNASSLIGSLNSNHIAALDGDRSETQMGVQCEVWF